MRRRRAYQRIDNKMLFLFLFSDFDQPPDNTVRSTGTLDLTPLHLLRRAFYAGLVISLGINSRMQMSGGISIMVTDLRRRQTELIAFGRKIVILVINSDKLP